jgi:hypothetical protein
MQLFGWVVMTYLLSETTSCRGTLAFGSRRKVALQIIAAELTERRKPIIPQNPRSHYQFKRIKKSPLVVSTDATVEQNIISKYSCDRSSDLTPDVRSWNIDFVFLRPIR